MNINNPRNFVKLSVPIILSLNLFDLLLKNTTTEESIISMANADETIRRGNTYVKSSKGISVF